MTSKAAHQRRGARVRALEPSPSGFKRGIAAFLLVGTLLPCTVHAQDMMGMNGHFGASMMPFDLNRSLHIFTPLPDGGLQDVVSLDNDPRQIALIRGHLQKQAMLRNRGDYSGPAAMHGAAMPGLRALEEGSAKIRVAFVSLPDGGRISYLTNDPALSEAIHRWFKAQARDHGDDAMISHD